MNGDHSLRMDLTQITTAQQTPAQHARVSYAGQLLGGARAACLSCCVTQW